MSIQRLPVFLSAAEHLNFTRAAEEQCISQTAVSQQIKLLEQELGYALFVRGKRGVSLTPAGEVFYRQCKQLMIRYNDAAAQGKKIALGNATDLRIGYAGAYELWTIVSQIRKYHRQHPEAAFSFQLGSNRSLLTTLAEGRLDMAVLSGFGVVLDAELASCVTRADPCVVMISAEHPLAAKAEIHPRELKGMPIVLNRAQDSQPSAAQIAGMYASMGLGGNPRMYADDFLQHRPHHQHRHCLQHHAGEHGRLGDLRRCFSPAARFPGEGPHAAGLSARFAGHGHPVVRVAHQAQALNDRKPGRPRTLVRDAPVVYGCSAAR